MAARICRINNAHPLTPTISHGGTHNSPASTNSRLCPEEKGSVPVTNYSGLSSAARGRGAASSFALSRRSSPPGFVLFLLFTTCCFQWRCFGCDVDAQQPPSGWFSEPLGEFLSLQANFLSLQAPGGQQLVAPGGGQPPPLKARQTPQPGKVKRRPCALIPRGQRRCTVRAHPCWGREGGGG